MVIAPVGAGKTTVAAAAAERLGGPSTWVTGTVSDRVVPFAAVRDLIEVPDDGKTAAVLRAARESVADGLLLIVDDAHLLDHLTATLVYQLAVSGAARLIVTVDPDEGAPGFDQGAATRQRAAANRAHRAEPRPHAAGRLGG